MDVRIANPRSAYPLHAAARSKSEAVVFGIICVRLGVLEQSEDLDNKVAAIRRAKSEVDKAIRNLEDMNHMLQVSSSFTALVDETIGLAKMGLMPEDFDGVRQER